MLSTAFIGMEARPSLIYSFLIVMGCFLPCDAKLVINVEVSNPGLNSGNVNSSYSFPARLAPIPECFSHSERMEFHASVTSPNRYFSSGCAAIDPPPKPNNDSLPAHLWIVLIQGKEDCNFWDEVHSAQDAGYHAAMIYGNDEWEANVIRSYICSYTSLRLDSKDIHIPTYFISQNDGFNLTNEYGVTRDQEYNLLFSITSKCACACERSLYERARNFVTQLFAELIVVAFELAIFLLLIRFSVLLFRVLVKIIKYFTNRRFWANIDGTNPKKEFKSGGPYETCAICYEKYIDGDQLRLLHCSHGYHSECVDRWLSLQKSCPTCTRRIY